MCRRTKNCHSSSLETDSNPKLPAREDPAEALCRRIQKIENLARRIGRRQGLPADDLDDFVGDVMLKLVENDYEVLRAFDGRCGLLAFLGSVIRHLAQDQRNRRWGKWHPSAAAKRLGLEALTLERLLYREGLAFTNAEARLREVFPRLQPEEIDELAGSLPPRIPGRRHVELETRVVIAPTQADESVLDAERSERKHRVLRALADGLAALDPSWQQALTFRYERGWRAARIAQRLGLSRRKVYRIFEYAKVQLRDTLTAQGIDAEIALLDIGWDIRSPIDEPAASRRWAEAA